MKILLHVVFLSFLLSTAAAQEKHFVFIQSDDKQPFNVTMNGKVYSSTASGYVIIPKLTEGEYDATIGFAANTYPEQSFKYVINKKDLGFNLKNFGDKGWGLFNLQTFAVTMAGNQNTSDVARAVVEPPKEEYKPEISFERKKELVTKTEDKPVANDAAINDQPKATVTNSPSTSVAAEAGKQQATQVTAEPSKTTATPSDNSANASGGSSSAVNKSAVKKVAEVKGSMGVYLTYVDENSKDTVQLIIPTTGKKKGAEDEKVSGSEAVSNTEAKASKRASKKETASGIEVVSNNETKTSKRASKKETVSGNEAVANNDTKTSKRDTKDDLQFLNMETNGNKKDTASKTSSTAKIAPTTDNVQPAQNSNCTNLATEQDFAKLKRKMAQETSDEKMINEAKKVFKNKCFTTSQVKRLSTLFLSDEGRYKFFDASYNFVSDTQLYSSLEKEFVDPAFVTRFKAMLHK